MSLDPDNCKVIPDKPPFSISTQNLPKVNIDSDSTHKDKLKYETKPSEPSQGRDRISAHKLSTYLAEIGIPTGRVLYRVKDLSDRDVYQLHQGIFEDDTTKWSYEELALFNDDVFRHLEKLVEQCSHHLHPEKVFAEVWNARKAEFLLPYIYEVRLRSLRYERSLLKRGLPALYIEAQQARNCHRWAQEALSIDDKEILASPIALVSGERKGPWKERVRQFQRTVKHDMEVLTSPKYASIWGQARNFTGESPAPSSTVPCLPAPRPGPPAPPPQLVLSQPMPAPVPVPSPLLVSSPLDTAHFSAATSPVPLLPNPTQKRKGVHNSDSDLYRPGKKRPLYLQSPSEAEPDSSSLSDSSRTISAYSTTSTTKLGYTDAVFEVMHFFGNYSDIEGDSDIDDKPVNVDSELVVRRKSKIEGKADTIDSVSSPSRHSVTSTHKHSSPEHSLDTADASPEADQDIQKEKTPTSVASVKVERDGEWACLEEALPFSWRMPPSHS